MKKLEMRQGQKITVAAKIKNATKTTILCPFLFKPQCTHLSIALQNFYASGAVAALIFSVVARIGPAP